MNLPAYRELQPVYQALARNRNSTANAALVHTRYVDSWVEHFREHDEAARKQLLENVAGLAARTEPLLQALHRRREALVKALLARLGLGEEIAPWRWERASQWRVVAGLGRANPLEIGFAWDPLLGVACLPGSSLKGAVRAWAEAQPDLDSGTREAIFGPRRPEGEAGPRAAGEVIFFAAYPQKAQLELDVMNVHFKAYYENPQKQSPLGNEGPTPLYFLAVPAGMVWTTYVLPRPGRPAAVEHARQAREWLDRCAAEWGLGAKTSVGYGYFEAAASEPAARGEASTSSECSGAGGPAIRAGLIVAVQTFTHRTRGNLSGMVAELEAAAPGPERAALARQLLERAEAIQPPLRPEERALLERVRKLI